MTTMSGAAMVTRALEEMGVSVIFGIPGGPIIPIYDRLYESPIRQILPRHEQAAAHGADALGRLSGRPGVCLATSGPGATNLLTGIATAYLDSSPMVALVGQVPQGVIGSDAFQEADVLGATLSMVKHSLRASTPEDIPRTIKGAFFLASTGRPGPVLVEIPLDVQRGQGHYHMPQSVSFRGYRPEEDTDLLWLDETIDALRKSQRPLIMAGGGVVRGMAFRELLELAERAGLPVAHTLMGKGAIPEDHPLSLGMVGMHGCERANRALLQADLVIAVGCRFSDRTTGSKDTFAQGARIVHLDVDPSEHGKNIPPHIRGTVSAKRALIALREGIGSWRGPRWIQNEENGKVSHGHATPNGGVSPKAVMATIGDMAGEEAIFTTEVGQNQMWAALHLKVRRPGGFITSGGLGTMGFGLPAAMGAAAGGYKGPVICIAGDGSLMMNVQELDTLARHGLPVKVLLLNNRCLGMVRQWQELFFGGRYSNTIYHRSPDFVGIAEAMGVRGFRVQREDELRGTLEEALGASGPALVDIWIPQDEKVMPMVPPGRGLKEMMTEP